MERFAAPYVLAFLILVPLAGWVSLAGYRRAKVASRKLWRGPTRISGVQGTYVLLIGAALAIVAGAAPQWGTETAKGRREAADLFIVIDVSRSMGVEDVPPSRLEAVKATLSQTLGRMSGQRVGVVVFGGDAKLRFPLTTDLNAADRVIQSLEPGFRFVDAGTSASSGLDVALGAFDFEHPSGKSILLVTDGDDLGQDPMSAASAIRAAGVSFLVAGVGTEEGGPVMAFDPQVGRLVEKTDAAGSPIISRSNASFLAEVAAAAGGLYLGNDLTALPGAVAAQATLLERTQLEPTTEAFPVPRFQWFAGAALALIAAAWLGRGLAGAVRGGLAGMSLVALLLVSGCATSAHTENEQGRALFRSGDVEGSIEKFYAAEAADPRDMQVVRNLAHALIAAGRYEEAARAARRVLFAGGTDDRLPAFQLLANAQFQSGDLEAALNTFKQALIDSPDDEMLRHDYEVVFRTLNPPGLEESGGQPASPSGGGSGQGGGVGQTTSPESTPGSGGGSSSGSQPQPGQSQGAGNGSEGRPSNIESLEEQIAALDGRIRAALSSGEQPSAEDAVTILDLLAERSRLNSLRDGFSQAGVAGDY